MPLTQKKQLKIEILYHQQFFFQIMSCESIAKASKLINHYPRLKTKEQLESSI